MGLSQFQKMKILTLSILLLAMAFFSAQSHALTVSKSQLIQSLQSWEAQVSAQKNIDPREHDLQVQFIQRLIFQTESKYREQDLNGFLQTVLQDMQETDDFGYFIEGLNEGLTTLLEKNEDALSFSQAYLEFSGIQNPRDVSDFADIRSYYDGRRMLKAETMEVEEVAELLEQRELAAQNFKSDWTPKSENLIEQYKELQPSGLESETSIEQTESRPTPIFRGESLAI
jgi:hypothetical protein